MQRVLSFQMARGLGESSEFVTKRMCCSFLFSIGFLCLLCGFLLGRFASERAMEFRAERRRLELAGNGLESTEHLQQFLLQELEKASSDTDLTTELLDPMNGGLQRIVKMLQNLSFVHEVVEREAYLTATVRGSREPDRYVVLSTSGDGIGIVLDLARILNQIQDDFSWKSRRTLIFCISFGSSDVCPEILPTFARRKVVAYVNLRDHDLKDNGKEFMLSGSDIIQSIIFQAAIGIKKFDSYYERFLSPHNVSYNTVVIPRLTLDTPHATLSFARENITHRDNNHNTGLRKITAAQILGRIIWRLSECLIVRWNPNYFNETIYAALELTDDVKLSGIKDKILEVLNTLVHAIDNLNKRIDATECTKILEVRILNDLLMDLDRALLCPDSTLQSKTDLAVLFNLSRKSSTRVFAYLSGMAKCYETAIQVLQYL